MVHEIDNLQTLNQGNVLVDFYTSTCGPCKALNPVLEEIAEEYRDLKVAKVEVTRNPDATQLFGIMSVPTVMFLKDSKVKEIFYGFSNKSTLKSMISKHLNHAHSS